METQRLLANKEIRANEFFTIDTIGNLNASLRRFADSGYGCSPDFQAG